MPAPVCLVARVRRCPTYQDARLTVGRRSLTDTEAPSLPGGFGRQIGNHCRSSPLRPQPAEASTAMGTISQNRNDVTLDEQELLRLDAYWRAANYLSVGQIYLLEAARATRHTGAGMVA